MKNDWSQFLKNLAGLIKVKTIVTLVVIAVFAILALEGRLESDVVMSVVMMVVAFYFGTQKERQDHTTSEEGGALTSNQSLPCEKKAVSKEKNTNTSHAGKKEK